MSRKGCALWWAILAVMLAFVWARISLPLEELGTVEHVGRDGAVKENPIATVGMIVILCAFVVVVAVMLTRAEKKASDDVLLAPVAKACLSGRQVGCGSGLAMLAILAVAGVLVWIAAMVGGI